MIVIARVEVPSDFVGRQCLGVAAVPFSLRGGHAAIRHEASNRLGAASCRRDDLSAADAAALQEPGTLIAGHEILGFAGDSHGEQEGVVRVIGFDPGRQMFKHHSSL